MEESWCKMGRLIDDIKLRASIDANEILETNKPLEKIIDELPTAYDVEKVLSELEVLLDLVNMNQKLAVMQAIDIVKKGGVSND